VTENHSMCNGRSYLPSRLVRQNEIRFWVISLSLQRSTQHDMEEVSWSDYVELYISGGPSKGEPWFHRKNSLFLNISVLYYFSGRQ
jgi:hypothetical protein